MTAMLSRDQVRLSKRLALVLRHRPETVGLTLDANGWVPVADLLTALRLSRADLDMIVENNDKSRFAIARRDDGVDWIRASQGHSRRVEVDLGLPPAELEKLLAGTQWRLKSVDLEDRPYYLAVMELMQ